MNRDRLLQLKHAHKGVAEAGECRSGIRLERNGTLLDFPRLLIALLSEQHEAEIGKRLDVAWLDRDRLRQSLLREIQPAAIERRYTKQVQRMEMVGHEPQYLPADPLRLGMLTCTIGGDSRRHQYVRLFAALLLQPRVLECARTDRALQGELSGSVSLVDLARIA